MPLLDELSGFEFEDTMEIVFEKMGYRNVRQSRKTADEGRDILMEEQNAGGPPTAVVVECKHTKQVGRPVVQKLDSAVSTYAHNGPKRGMIVTTGRFTGPAKEYADRVNIELMDGHDIREVADDIGMDLYNGRIEILCDELVNPFHPDGPAAPVMDEFDSVANLSPSDIPDPRTTVTLYPVVTARTHTQRTFETGAGVIHRVNDTAELLLDGSRDGPRLLDDPVRRVVTQHGDDRVTTDVAGLEKYFDSVNDRRFAMTETEFRDWLADREVERHTQTVTYTGDNNVTYNKECEPSPSDVEIQSFTPLYAPRIYGSVALGDYSYSMDWFAAGDHTAVIENDITGCVHCTDENLVSGSLSVSGLLGLVSKHASGTQYTYCSNCGAIGCQEHIRTEAVTGDPVCTGCAVTGRFALAEKHFYNETNRAEYETDYEDYGIGEKVQENIPGAVGIVLCLLAFVFLFLL